MSETVKCTGCGDELEDYDAVFCEVCGIIVCEECAWSENWVGVGDGEGGCAGMACRKCEDELLTEGEG